MADTVTNQVILGGKSTYVVHLTGISDGTGESNVVKIDKSTLLNTIGVEPPRIIIQSIRWASQGFSYIKLSWDHATDVTAMILNGNGYENFEEVGGLKDTLLNDSTGDLLLTSVGAANGSTYDITLVCSLQ